LDKFPDAGRVFTQIFRVSPDSSDHPGFINNKCGPFDIFNLLSEIIFFLDNAILLRRFFVFIS